MKKILFGVIATLTIVALSSCSCESSTEDSTLAAPVEQADSVAVETLTVDTIIVVDETVEAPTEAPAENNVTE